jgi:ribosomal protein S27E
MNDRKLEDKPACSVKSAAAPLEVTCSQCKAEVEIWSDEPEAVCSTCGNVVKK